MRGRFNAGCLIGYLNYVFVCFVSIPNFLRAFVIEFCDIDTDLELCFFLLLLLLIVVLHFSPFPLEIWKTSFILWTCTGCLLCFRGDRSTIIFVAL